jgi:hypothetical protein
LPSMHNLSNDMLSLPASPLATKKGAFKELAQHD